MVTHYIIIRRDLPLGTALAMTTHAAGESAHLYSDESGRFRGATAVVLGVDSKEDLLDIQDDLTDNNIQYVSIREDAHPYNGQLMAIGVVPGNRTIVGRYLSHIPTLKTLLNPQENLDNYDEEC